MNIKLLIAALLTTLLFSSSAYSQLGYTQVVTFDCRGGPELNGINTSREHASPNRPSGIPGMSASTRQGNNGSGNGGEAFDVFIDYDHTLQIQYISIVCLETDENTGGTVHIDSTGDGEYNVFLPQAEFDPGGF